MSDRAALSASLLALLVLLSSPAWAGDDWSFVAGRYAVNADDCKVIAAGKPFSKEWVEGISEEVLTKEGITSARETHCKFRGSSKSGDGKWTVKADCEEMGEAEPYELAVEASGDGAVAILSEDMFGPEPLKFQKCD